MLVEKQKCIYEVISPRVLDGEITNARILKLYMDCIKVRNMPSSFLLSASGKLLCDSVWLAHLSSQSQNIFYLY